jgi:hypothetical protein
VLKLTRQFLRLCLITLKSRKVDKSFERRQAVNLDIQVNIVRTGHC